MVSQTSEWKMSFVILVSAARRLADMALWLQSPFEMELEGRGGWVLVLSQLSGIWTQPLRCQGETTQTARKWCRCQAFTSFHCSSFWPTPSHLHHHPSPSNRQTQILHGGFGGLSHHFHTINFHVDHCCGLIRTEKINWSVFTWRQIPEWF